MLRQFLILTLGSLLLLLAPAWAEEAPAEGGEKAVTQYVPLDPAFVINLEGSGRRAHFMQIRAQVAVESKEDADAVTYHMPVIRDTMVMYFSGKTMDEARSVQQRETWRTELQTELQTRLEAATGKPLIKGLYFTSFVVQ